jgi:hypothetical protein
MYVFNFVTASGQVIEPITSPNLDAALVSLISVRQHDGNLISVREKGDSTGVYKCAYYLDNYVDFEVTYTKVASFVEEEVVFGQFV